jgi:parallel beta-helix repeat protein
MKKIHAAALFVSLLVSAFVGAEQGGLVSAQFSSFVTITADGTVDPVDAPIQWVGDVYTLTGDLSRIKVDRNNVILDGNGHTCWGGGRETVILDDVRNVVIKNLTVAGGKIGIYLNRCFNITVSGSNITGTSVILPQFEATGGVYVVGGSNQFISGNYIADNVVGVFLVDDVVHTRVVDNDIVDNGQGISLWESSFNFVYGNNFVNNSRQVRDAGADFPAIVAISMNSWDDGSVGNFWSDYSGSDADGDGVGDRPYVVYTDNRDYFPLVAPLVRELPFPPSVSVLSPTNGSSVSASVPLDFSVDKQVAWMGYSLDGQDNVTVAGNGTLSGLPDGVHMLTVYANDTFGFTGASETVTFTVDTPEPFPTTLVISAVVVAVVVCAGLLLYFTKFKKKTVAQGSEGQA